VKLVDAALPAGFELLEGSGKAAFAKIDVGSKVTHSYVLKVTTAQDIQALEPAKVTYVVDADGEKQVGQGGSGRGVAARRGIGRNGMEASGEASVEEANSLTR
jgi:hypothetical protein